MDFKNRDKAESKFVCPSDRQLALRAKLHTGWSTRKPTGTLRPDEQAAIISVIRRNEDIEIAERQRVGRLVERVEKIKERAADCGPNCCRLCGQTFGFLGPSKLVCCDCHKSVCSKCSIELGQRNSYKSRDIHLCRICSETREMWKKSGAWFFKCLPQYEVPSSTRSSPVRTSRKEKPKRPIRMTKLGMELDEESGSSDEEHHDNIGDNQRSSPYTTIQRDDSFRLRTVGSFRSFFEHGERKFSNSFFFNRQPSRSDSCSQPDWDAISGISTITTTNINSAGSLRERRESNNYNRRGSVSSSWSVSESSSGNGSSTMPSNQIRQICQTEPPLGWLEVEVSYCEMNHTLSCIVLRARDLPAMDSAGLADPFCKLNIITADGTTKQSKWLKIKTVHKTKNPEFNESVTFLGVEPEELGNSILYVVILDDDKFGHDFLGAAKIGLSTLHNASPHRLTIPLVTEDQFSSEAVNAGPWPRGQILISLCYNTKKRSLVIIVKCCTDLLPMDNNGSSDPFVKLQLKPDSHRKKYKTSVKWHNLNPIYNEEFLFETRPNDLDKQCLIITVWDKDLGKSNDFLGSLILGHNSKGRRLKQWQDCVRLPDHYHEQWHCLSSENLSH